MLTFNDQAKYQFGCEEVEKKKLHFVTFCIKNRNKSQCQVRESHLTMNIRCPLFLINVGTVVLFRVALKLVQCNVTRGPVFSEHDHEVTSSDWSNQTAVMFFGLCYYGRHCPRWSLRTP